MTFVIVDRLNNAYGVFDSPASAGRWATARLGDTDDWQCRPLRAPDDDVAFSEGDSA